MVEPAFESNRTYRENDPSFLNGAIIHFWVRCSGSPYNLLVWKGFRA
jgi:hypothetical protein